MERPEHASAPFAATTIVLTAVVCFLFLGSVSALSLALALLLGPGAMRSQVE